MYNETEATKREIALKPEIDSKIKYFTSIITAIQKRIDFLKSTKNSDVALSVDKQTLFDIELIEKEMEIFYKKQTLDHWTKMALEWEATISTALVKCDKELDGLIKEASKIKNDETVTKALDHYSKNGPMYIVERQLKAEFYLLLKSKLRK